MTTRNRIAGVILLVAAFATPGPGETATGADAAALELVQVAPGIYLHHGRQEEMSVANRGDIANIGFIVGRDSVAVIDPGGSPAIGAALRAAIRELTRLPVSHVIMTHLHPDHVFGAGAFAEARQIIAHRNFARALTQRGDFYRRTWDGLFTRPEQPLTLAPTFAVDSETSIDLGGRILRLRAHRSAHTDNDLSVFDPSTGTLWAGDLLFARRIPSLDGSLPGWLEVMDELAALEPALVIPGHGEPGTWAEIAAPQRRYLETLLHETRDAVARNRKLSDAIDEIGRGERGSWRLFESHHRGNVSRAFTELEWE